MAISTPYSGPQQLRKIRQQRCAIFRFCIALLLKLHDILPYSPIGSLYNLIDTDSQCLLTIFYYLHYFDDQTRSSFGAFLNPALCWGGLLALFALIFRAAKLREKEALFILAGYFAQLVPWMFVTRLTFEYHYFPSSVFLVLALAYVFRLIENETEHGKAYPVAFAALSGALFVLFYPVLSGLRVESRLASQLLQWLPTWPF